MVSKKRQEMREKLRNRTEQSEKTREDSGRFGSFFKSNLPEGAQFWTATKGRHTIDIIPYEAGVNDPDPTTKEGDPTYVLDLFVHNNIGVNEDSVICPARTYKKPCPICEHQKQLRQEDDYDEDLVKSLNPTRRCIYNIVCYDTDKEEDKGVQIWPVAHWFFERHLTSLARNSRTGELELFADPDEGKSIEFDREGVGKTNTSYVGHKFIERPDPIPDEYLEQVFCLDELIDIKSYDDIYKLYWQEEPPDEGEGEGEGEQEEREKPKTSRTRRVQRPQRETRAKSNVKEDECPHGGEFGVDLGELNECSECQVFEQCSKRMEELQAGGDEEEQEPEQEKKKTEKRVSQRRRRR